MAKINDLSAIIKEKIKNYDLNVLNEEEGRIISVSDGIASVAGLDKTKSSELLKFPGDLYGMALSLEEDYVGVILFGEYDHIKEGDKVQRTGTVVEIPVGDELIGRVVSPLGKPLDNATPIKAKKTRYTERIAPGIMSRQSVYQPLETGILSIDSMIPIGKGQRELIIGDKKTGKTAIAIDTIINQKGKDVLCVYVSIGQKNSTLVTTYNKLRDNGALEYTTIVAANASESDAIQYLAPYSGITIAEEWMEQGKDVLIVFDDLSKHAVAYRTVSLLLRRPPGREAYPGDVFYLHSRLLERSAKLNEENGGGSITALPIIETQAGDISAYIPTNVISITDGQIFLMADAFNSGQRPAIDPGLSVSRVGSAAQTKLIKSQASSLKLDLATYNEIKSFAEFSSDLDPETKATLENGERIMILLKQPQYSPIPQELQGLILFLVKQNLLASISVDKTQQFKDELLAHAKVDEDLKEIILEFKTKKLLTDETKVKLLSIIKKFTVQFNKTSRRKTSTAKMSLKKPVAKKTATKKPAAKPAAKKATAKPATKKPAAKKPAAKKATK